MSNKIISSNILLLILLLTFNISVAQDFTNFKNNKSSFAGSTVFTGTFYNAEGTEERRAPFSGIITGNFTVNIKGFAMPFSFSYSNRNKEFRQPFNQFGMSPRYKWATLHLGYRNINFSKYVLGGHTVFGIGTELNPGKLHFGYMYGRLKKYTNQAVNIFKPLNDTLMDFSRKMTSIKIGFGSNQTFFDINLLRAYDDSTSVSKEFLQKKVFPQANAVTGLHTRIQLGENLYFETEGAVSIFTENQNSTEIYNSISTSINKIIPVNASTSLTTAVESKINYKTNKGFNIGVQYRRIDPKYRSMGTYFMNNDMENITLKTAFRILDNKMNVSGSFGTERNNLKTLRNATTHKTIGSFNLNYNPSVKFGISANYSNYSVNQQAGRVQIADSVKLYQTNGTIMLSPHYSFFGKNKKTGHFISYVFTKMQLTDKNPESLYNNDFTTMNNILSYNINFIKQKLSVSLGLNYTEILMSAGNSKVKGINLGMSKRFSEPKISTGINFTYSNNIGETSTSNTFVPSFNTNIRLGKHHKIRLKGNFIFSDKPETNEKYYEEILILAYTFNF